MGQLIDTSVFIELERRGLSLSALASAAPSEPVALAAITASELLAGVHRAESEGRRLRRESFVEAILEHIPVLAFDLRVARIHARTWSELAGSGQMVGAHDLLIAATALAHDHSVLTHNVRDFERIPGLAVRRPWA